MRCLLVLVALASSTAVAHATPLLRADSRWEWHVVSAPRIAPQIGAMAASGVDAVAGRAPAAIDPLGVAVPAPARWPFALDRAGAATIAAPADDARIAAAFGITQFTLDASHEGFEMLELRLRYEDGIAVWLNGVEIARQALPVAAETKSTTLALRPHGPEWETFHVAVAPGLLRLGANTLAVEVHPSGRRRAPTVAAELAGRRDRGILRGPLLADVTATSAAIIVDTDPGTPATLTWGTGRTLDRTQTSPPGRRHRFVLDGLTQGAQVQYRVTAGATQTPAYAFHTWPKPGARLRLGVYGDVRGGHATHRKLVDRMLGEGLDLVAVTGDMVLHGADQADWQRFYAVTRDLLAQLPYWSAVGNHDLGMSFELPSGPPDRPAGTHWYSLDVADIHLVFLDSNAYDRPEQQTWLAADLAAARARNVRTILAFTHDGPYARGYHGGSVIARDRYVPILVEHGVALIFSGHDHIYQRGEVNGLRYVVTGGGGAPLYGIRCGIPGRPKCRVADGAAKIAKEHHYSVLTIGKDIELCTRKADGTLLEPCVRYPLR